VLSSGLQGVAVGLLWAPCAGPILGLVFTAAAWGGTSGQTVLLLLAYGLGAANSLALPLLAGGRLLRAIQRSRQGLIRLRRALGVAVLAAVAVIATGVDRGPLTRLALAGTTPVEEALLERFPVRGTIAAAPRRGSALPVLGVMPSLAGGVGWLHSPPLRGEQLRGKVVLVNFWTYSCINCVRTLPYVRAWQKKYRDHGLVVIGVHTPEFAFEKNIGNVRRESQRLGVSYPVLLDNNFTLWKRFENRYWPAFYFVDASGRIRRIHFGEGEYGPSERVIQELLADAGAANVPGGLVKP
jgi:thiol-disulfide isomerase/thioredoxin